VFKPFTILFKLCQGRREKVASRSESKDDPYDSSSKKKAQHKPGSQSDQDRLDRILANVSLAFRLPTLGLELES
jgi:hypothetical protein